MNLSATSPQLVEVDGPSRQADPGHRERRLLIILTLFWLPSMAAALALLFGDWLVSPEEAPARALLWLAIIAQTAVLLVGWLVAARRLLPQAVGAQPEMEEPAALPPFAPPQDISLATLMAMDPGEFEQWVAELFERRGYHTFNTPDSGDHGVDVRLIDPAGRPAIVQCKRFANTVGPEVVRELYGTVLAEQVVTGYLVTTASISEGARQWARGKPLELIDGERLLKLANARSVEDVFSSEASKQQLFDGNSGG